MTSIGDFGRSIGEAMMEGFGRAAGRVQERTPLPADLLESDEAYLVVFDAPGATASDIQVRYVEGSVRVRIDRFRDYHEGFEMRFPGRGLALDGRVDLPGDAVIDPEAAEATLRENGTLEVRVPKTEADHDEEAGDATVSVEGSAEEAVDVGTDSEA